MVCSIFSLIILNFTRFLYAFEKRFGTFIPSFRGRGKTFCKALERKNFPLLTEYLCYTSFHYYDPRRENAPNLTSAGNLFIRYLKEIEEISYIGIRYEERDNFIDLGYFATHVIFVLNNYGEFQIRESINKRKAENFIDKTSDFVGEQLGHLDLFAEYLQCLKMLNRGPFQE